LTGALMVARAHASCSRFRTLHQSSISKKNVRAASLKLEHDDLEALEK
jgi:hypothetical protein